MIQISPQPVVVVSRCLEFDRCRYNGQVIPERFVRQLQRYVRFRPVCPEVEIGLGIPRDPIRLVRQSTGETRLVQPASGRDVTPGMTAFIRSFCETLGDVDGFILKSGSPSCGPKGVKVYARAEGHARSGSGSGLFAGHLRQAYPGTAIEEEGRLSNVRIREHFLTRVFASARFRSVKEARSMKSLVQFHSRHKFLLMAYNQKYMRLMGRMVANAERHPWEDVIKPYEEFLQQTFESLPRLQSHVNVVLHVMGFFSQYVAGREKRHFLTMVDRYRQQSLPLSTLLGVLQSWIVRFEQFYLGDQVYFEPFPSGLTALEDSGKGREVKALPV